MPPTRPTIIDIEASGFGPDSYPIEIGVVLGNGKRYCSLITPKPDWTHWSDSAEQVHKIPRQLLFEHGKPAEQVSRELNQLLERKTIYSDGWVVDNPWLIHLFHSARIRQQFRFSSLEMILSEEQMQIWHTTKSDIENELQLQRHRASNDALIVQETFYRTRALINSRHQE